MPAVSCNREGKPITALAIAGETRDAPTISKWTTTATVGAAVAKLPRGQRLLPRAMEP